MATTSSTSTAGTILSATSISGYKDQVQTYLANYRKLLETQNLTSLNTRMDTYVSQKNAISDLATKMTSLQTTVSLLSNTSSDSIFSSFSASINTTNFINPILTGTLSPGNYAISVKQLAKNDKMLSNSISVLPTDTNIIAEGYHEFTLNVGTETFTINFSVDADESNSSIMQKVVEAVNSAAGSKVNASLINDTTNTTKLVFSSKETGSNNAINFTDPGVLTNLGITSTRTTASGILGGYVTTNISELDAIVNIDGIDITRSTNNISGVIPGLTLDLKSVNQLSDSPTNLIISPGKDNVKALLDKFIEDYNSVVKYINDQTKIIGSSRSIFSGDMTLRTLTLQMRSILNQNVSSVASNAPSSLASIGIKTNSDGTLAWGDVTKFNQAFESGVNNIADIFNSVNGLATNLNKYINTYTRSGGVLYNKSLSIQNQIKSIESRIANTKLRIDKRVDQVTMSYNNLLSNIVNLQNQQEMMQQAQSNMMY
jgi:flagellar hook-associated protein 2